jgi:hypothetical protein
LTEVAPTSNLFTSGHGPVGGSLRITMRPRRLSTRAAGVAQAGSAASAGVAQVSPPPGPVVPSGPEGLSVEGPLGFPGEGDPSGDGDSPGVGVSTGGGGVVSSGAGVVSSGVGSVVSDEVADVPSVPSSATAGAAARENAPMMVRAIRALRKGMQLSGG